MSNETIQLIAPPAWAGKNEAEKNFVDWDSLLNGRSFPALESSAPRVLVASNTGLHGAVMTLDSTLCVSLKLRGADVHYALCDGILPGCLMATLSDNLSAEHVTERGLIKTHCKGCFNRGSGVLRGTGAFEHRLSGYLTERDYTDAQAWAEKTPYNSATEATLDGVPVGEHAVAGALRFFASGDLAGEPCAEAVVQRYLEGGYLTFQAYDRMLDELQPDVIVLHHGIYSPQGIAAKIAQAKGIRVVTWVVSYRKGTFIFSHDDTYHHTLMDEPVTQWRDIELSESANQELDNYLASRSGGGKDWIYFHKDSTNSFKGYAQDHGIDLDKPIISLLTNVMWDAQLHYPQNAFPSMKDWIIDSINLFAERPGLQGVIRIHPAEERGAVPARQKLADEIAKAFPTLPDNVHVIGPLDDVSTYELAASSNAVVIFGTKMGVELTPLGKPVIVAGEAWIRNKELTIDVRSREEYAEVFDSLPLAQGESTADTHLARRYAYHFFFRRMIPLPFVEPSGNSAFFHVAIDSAEELGTQRWPGLDVICDGILEGRPFVYPAEVVDHAEKKDVPWNDPK